MARRLFIAGEVGGSLGFGRGGGRGGAVQARPEVRGFVVEWREGLLMVTRGSLLFSNKIRLLFWPPQNVTEFHFFSVHVLVAPMHSCSICKRIALHLQEEISTNNQAFYYLCNKRYKLIFTIYRDEHVHIQQINPILQCPSAVYSVNDSATR